MPKKQDERTLQLKEKYFYLHNDGYTNSEIAKKCNVSIATLYRYLPEIAAEHGMTKQELLNRQFVANHANDRKNYTPVNPVDKDIQEHIQKAIEEINAMRQEIAELIEILQHEE